MKIAIQIDDLAFQYGKEEIINGLNVGFEKGKLSVILGRNGSGKSTLFHVMTGLEKNYSGTVSIYEKDRKKLTYANLSSILGFLPQFHKTTFPFKVIDVLLTGRAAFSTYMPHKKDYEIAESVLTDLNLLHLRDKEYTSLSGGERQLILLARVLVQQPEIILLDEPTNHLDLYYQVFILEKLKTLTQKGITVICIMHDPNLAFMYGDEFYVMRNKGLVELRDLNDLQRGALLEEVYQLPLIFLENQGKLMISPLLQQH
ncbi:ABC transporter ATP-binding protein [Flavobacterium sp. '19STA2R22 D10 B1']|uniref:ABC transporter ATP-binding protein n=1 Tax=Flavobacterium aerium TaxID=3037261 RepID=UPI00278C62C0|nr:ABC transporter ATP-binding protein [Flavobacterium sp. '19STA2R22 D10 B1']